MLLVCILQRDIEEVCQLSTKALNYMVNLFLEKGWLKKVSLSERYRSFIFEPYLKLFE
jgi:hypothetical protein